MIQPARSIVGQPCASYHKVQLWLVHITLPSIPSHTMTCASRPIIASGRRTDCVAPVPQMCNHAMAPHIAQWQLHNFASHTRCSAFQSCMPSMHVTRSRTRSSPSDMCCLSGAVVVRGPRARGSSQPHNKVLVAMPLIEPMCLAAGASTVRAVHDALIVVEAGSGLSLSTPTRMFKRAPAFLCCNNAQRRSCRPCKQAAHKFAQAPHTVQCSLKGVAHETGTTALLQHGMQSEMSEDRPMRSKH